MTEELFEAVRQPARLLAQSALPKSLLLVSLPTEKLIQAALEAYSDLDRMLWEAGYGAEQVPRSSTIPAPVHPVAFGFAAPGNRPRQSDTSGHRLAGYHRDTRRAPGSTRQHLSCDCERARAWEHLQQRSSAAQGGTPWRS